MKPLPRTVSLVLAAALISTPGRASEAGPQTEVPQVPGPRPGELVEGLSAAPTTDGGTAERYAAYLPSAYLPEASWPVLIVMDPRGRAGSAAEIFRPAAERFGYIVLSSEGTRSDLPDSEATDPNESALRALFEVAADAPRIYLAGFSGTSRVAWMAGKAFPGRVAGVIGVGGGLPGPWQDWREVAFSYFGAAGRHDFNHAEMRELDDLLDGVLAHRFRYFPGVHQWLRPEDAERALGWMELEAMRRGRQEVRPKLVAELFVERLEEADRAEERDAAFETFEALLAIAEDFDGLVSEVALEPVRARATRLAEDRRVDRTDKEIRAAIQSEKSYRDKIGTAVRGIAYESAPPDPNRLAGFLGIPDLRAVAQTSSLRADSAQRKLELAFVHMAFYTPRGLMAKDAPRRAALSLEVATRIFPERPFGWLQLAEAWAQSGHKRSAISALTEAVDRGFTDRDYLRTHAGFDELRETSGFEELVARLGAELPAPPPG